MEKETGLSLSVYDMAGKVSGKITLPKELFDAKINKQLIAQAVRVYLTNQRQGTVDTRTRGEVTGSTRKIYRQKGTGRARHGGIRAPIFVKGGIAHGPKPKDYDLHLSKNMRRAALAAALTAQLKDGAVKVVIGLGAIEPKTKVVATALKTWGLDKKVLFVLPGKMENVEKAARNVAPITLTALDRLNTYEVIGHKTIVLFKETVEKMEERLKGQK